MTASVPLDGPRWELWGQVDAAGFFRSLAAGFPTATTIFIEGRPTPDVDALLRSAAEPGPYLPDRETTWPRQNLYRVRFDGPALEGLAGMAERHAVPELLDHLHVYEGDTPLLGWHDAFDRASPMRVAPGVDRERLLRFAADLGAEPWVFPRPDQPMRDARNRVLLVVGVWLLALWAAAVCALFISWAIEHGAREADGMSWGFSFAVGWFILPQSAFCGVALIFALLSRSVRDIRGLRGVVVAGLAAAWFVIVASCGGWFG